MTGEKFHFLQVFSSRGKTLILLCAIIFLILDFIASSKTKDIARRSLTLSVRVLKTSLIFISFAVLLYSY